MIAGTFTVTFDDLDDLVEAIAERVAGRIAAMFGHDPDAVDSSGISEDRDGPEAHPVGLDPETLAAARRLQERLRPL